MRKWLEKIARFFPKEDMTGPYGELYMTRYTMWEGVGRAVYLQKFHNGDWSRAPHDHPRLFLSIGLCGAYMEHIYHLGTGRELLQGHRSVYRVAPFLNIIEAARVHRIVHVESETWTLCFVGGRVREWGFYPNGVFVPSKKYIKEMYKEVK